MHIWMHVYETLLFVNSIVDLIFAHALNACMRANKKTYIWWREIHLQTIVFALEVWLK